MFMIKSMPTQLEVYNGFDIVQFCNKKQKNSKELLFLLFSG